MTDAADMNLRNEAISWHLRLRDGVAADWDAFVTWLEADPAHANAYDAVARADAAFHPSLLPSAVAANDDAPERRSWRIGRWAGIAAALALLVAAALLLLPRFGSRPDRYEIATANGERRAIALGDGSRVELNGATRLVLDRADPRYAELAAGEAAFTIRHDPARPFTVRAGEHRIQDLGTSFDLVHEPRRFEVGVIEGAVLVDPDGGRVRLGAGQVLRAEADGPAVLARADAETIGGWRRGQLSYRAAPLARVAEDLSRSLGHAVSLDPPLRLRPFTGSIRLGADEAATLSGFAASLGLRARRDGRNWSIGPDAPSPR